MLLDDKTRIYKLEEETKKALELLNDLHSKSIKEITSYKKEVRAWGLGILGAVCALVISFYTFLIPIIVRDQTASHRQDIGDLKGEIKEVKAQLGMILSGILKKAATGNSKELKQNLREISTILSELLKAEIALPLEVFNDAGIEILKLDPQDSETRILLGEVNNQLIQYRSFLNARQSSETGPRYMGKDMPVIGISTIHYTLIADEKVHLDLESYSMVIFRNCEIYYSDLSFIIRRYFLQPYAYMEVPDPKSPLPGSLDKVYFENCRFHIDLSLRGRKLSKAILTTTPVTIDLARE